MFTKKVSKGTAAKAILRKGAGGGGFMKAKATNPMAGAPPTEGAAPATAVSTMEPPAGKPIKGC